MKAYKVIIVVVSTVLLLLSIFSFRLIHKFVQKDYLEVSSDIIYHSSEELYGQIEYLSRLQARLREKQLSEIRPLFEGYRSAKERSNLYKTMKPYIYNNFKSIYSEGIYQELDGLLEEITDLIHRISEYLIEAEETELDSVELAEEIAGLIRQMTASKSRYGRNNHDLNIENILVWPYQVNSQNDEADILGAIQEFKATMKNIYDIIDGE